LLDASSSPYGEILPHDVLMTGRNARYFSKPPGGVWGGPGPVSTRFLSCIGRNAREISKAQVWLGPSPVSTRMLTFAVTHRTNACDISSSESARMSNIFHITMRHFLVCNFPCVLRGFLEATSTSYRKIRGLLFPKVDIA